MGKRKTSTVEVKAKQEVAAVPDPKQKPAKQAKTEATVASVVEKLLSKQKPSKPEAAAGKKAGKKQVVEEPVEEEVELVEEEEKPTAPAVPLIARPAQKQIDAVQKLIDTIDFEPFIARIVVQFDWSQEHIDYAIKMYKRFLLIRKFDEDVGCTPDIDVIWQEHIIHTKAYAEDTIRIFGSFLHHVPTHPEDDEEEHATRAERLQATHKIFFPDEEEMAFLYDDSDDEDCCSNPECEDPLCGGPDDENEASGEEGEEEAQDE